MKVREGEDWRSPYTKLNPRNPFKKQLSEKIPESPESEELHNVYAKDYLRPARRINLTPTEITGIKLAKNEIYKEMMMVGALKETPVS